MEFWAKLIETPDNSEFLAANCTHVINEFWIFEGDTKCLDEELSTYKIIEEGGVPGLGDLSAQQIMDGCEDWFGVKFKVSIG